MNHEAPRPSRLAAFPWVGLLLALTVLVATVATIRSLPTSTVILVRHAEKQAGSSDPSLTPEGAARAERLATVLDTLGGTPVKRIFSTEFHRTQETVQPLARKLGVPVTVVPGKDMSGLVAQLLAQREGASVVVGHSNTVPMVIARLTGGQSTPTISEDDFGSLFVVHVGPIGPPMVLRLRY